MTIPYAAGLLSILRGNVTDGWGDAKDTPVVVAEHVIGLPVEVEANSRTRNDQPGARDEVRAVLRLPVVIDIRKDDRVRDEASGVVWWVRRTPRQVANPVTGPTWRVDLVRTE